MWGRADRNLGARIDALGVGRPPSGKARNEGANADEHRTGRFSHRVLPGDRSTDQAAVMHARAKNDQPLVTGPQHRSDRPSPGTDSGTSRRRHRGNLHGARMGSQACRPASRRGHHAIATHLGIRRETDSALHATTREVLASLRPQSNTPVRRTRLELHSTESSSLR